MAKVETDGLTVQEINLNRLKKEEEAELQL